MKLASKLRPSGTKLASKWHLAGASLQPTCTKLAPVDMKFDEKTINGLQFLENFDEIHTVHVRIYWQEFAISQLTKMGGPS